MHNKQEISIGSQINFWTIIEQAPNIVRSLAYRCRCICGYEKINVASDVRNGRTKGCRSCTRHIRPYEALYNILIGTAKRRNISCSLIYAEFLVFTSIQKCHYCNGPIFWTKHAVGKNGSAYNLDRKDNKLGYHFNNLVVCCPDCNATKWGRLTYEEMKAVGNIRKKN